MSDSQNFNPCADTPICPNGNCIGCLNGNINCQDPVCQGFCQGCNPPSSFDFNLNFIFALITFCLILILFILWFKYGPCFFVSHSNHDRANVLKLE